MSESAEFHPGAAAEATAYIPRTLDNRLTILSSRMLYVSGSFFFASFYFGLVYLQIINSNNMWLPHGVDHPPSWMGASETALVLAAGISYFWGQWFGLYQRKFSQFSTGAWIAAVLTVAAVIIHIIELHIPGFTLQSGAYASLFIAIEGVFTFLLAMTAIVLIGVAIRATKNLFSASPAGAAAFGEWFGWIAAIALFNFLALYVQPFFPIA